MISKIKAIIVLIMFVCFCGLHIASYFISFPNGIAIVIFPCILIAFAMLIIDVNIETEKRLLARRVPIKLLDRTNVQGEIFSEAKDWQIFFMVIVIIYSFITFISSILVLSNGSPEKINGKYMANDHGVYTQISYYDFLNKERAESKLSTSAPLVFVGLPLVYYIQIAREGKSKNNVKPIQ